jgi:hypothetical protein
MSSMVVPITIHKRFAMYSCSTFHQLEPAADGVVLYNVVILAYIMRSRQKALYTRDVYIDDKMTHPVRVRHSILRVTTLQ